MSIDRDRDEYRTDAAAEQIVVRFVEPKVRYLPRIEGGTSAVLRDTERKTERD